MRFREAGGKQDDASGALLSLAVVIVVVRPCKNHGEK